MKTKDKEFIREIISSDFKHVTNPDFKFDTLKRVRELEETELIHSNRKDMTVLFPVFVFAFLFILISIFRVIVSWMEIEQISNIIQSIEMISGYLLHPVIISIVISFSLLYLFDLYLTKQSAKFIKSDIR